MLGENAGDVVVNHHHFINLAEPLFGEHANRGRAAADPHALFLCAIDRGRLACLHHHGGAVVNAEFYRLAVAQIQQRLAGRRAFLATAAGQVAHTAERQHLRTVFAGGDVPDGLTLRSNCIRLWPQMTVSINLYLDAAVAENSFSDHGDQVHPLHRGRNDERRRLVIGIGCARADGSHEVFRTGNNAAIPIPIAIQERNHRIAARHGAIQHHMRINPYQLSVLVAVTIARARPSRLDVAQDGTGIASDGVVFRHVFLPCGRRESQRECGPASQARGGCGHQLHRESR